MGIRWAGWETNTLRLQQAGWQIAVEMIDYDHRYRLFLKHADMHLYAMSTMATYQFDEITSVHADVANLPVFSVVNVAPRYEVIKMMEDFSGFKEVDAQTQIVHDHKIQTIEDMNIFAPAPQTRTEEILIDQANMTVIEHLEAIKAMQSEKQREIRQRMLKERNYKEGSEGGNVQPGTEVLAQVVQLRAVA